MSPNRIASPCSQPGCPAVATKGYCPKHRRARQRAYAAQPNRQRAQRQYHTGEWRELRAGVLERDPICMECKRAPSAEAAHIVARANAGADTMTNLRGLCHSCHSRETATRDGAFGNPVI